MMISNVRNLWAFVILALCCTQASAQVPEGAVEDLGGGRYRIGTIEVDKASQRFTVPGRIIGLAEGAPVEFLAVAKDGFKSYEALVELNASAIEFNTACILIGLDEANAVQPRHHFDQQEVTGDVVDITISWVVEGVEKEIGIERILKDTENPADHVWVYTGSYFTPDGQYGAEMAGTLIGVVHDRESVIQHQAGLGLGNYGAITLDPEVIPPGDTPVTVSVFRVAE